MQNTHSSSDACQKHPAPHKRVAELCLHVDNTSSGPSHGQKRLVRSCDDRTDVSVLPAKPVYSLLLHI